MSHMQKQITQEHFYLISTSTCEEYLVPESVCSTSQVPDNLSEFEDYTEGGEVIEVESVFGFFCRMSAPGYMDSTDWIGPFDTEEEADNCLELNYIED